jgi:hypothetical protein
MYEALKEVVAFFQSGEIEGCSVRELNDRFQDPMPGGYRDIQLVVEYQGHMCELQLNTEAMLRAKKTTGHRDFEVLRELTASIKDQDSERVRGALHFGLEHLGSEQLQEGEESASSSRALKKLLRSDESSQLLLEACRLGNATIVSQLLVCGADANAASSISGDTALHEAVFHGNQGCAWAVS